MDEGGNSLAEKVKMACQRCGCPGEAMTPQGATSPLPSEFGTLGPNSPPGPLEEVVVTAKRIPDFAPPDMGAGDQTMDLPPIAAPQVAQPGDLQLTDAVQNLTTKTEENSGFLTEGNLALADNIANTGLLIGTLFKNSSVGERLQKVMLALKLATIALKVTIAIQTAMAKAEEAGGFLKALFSQGANGGIAMGGITPYKNGGIVTAPKIGLVGEGKYNEAIVPLPNGRAIPVDMKGSGNQENNIAVNIVMDGNGNVTSESQKQDAAREQAELGKRITQAIKAELANQKRPGGQLSPYA
jgi:hypothetical protein